MLWLMSAMVQLVVSKCTCVVGMGVNALVDECHGAASS